MASQWEGLRNLEAPGPDYFIPEVFTLAGGEVQGMETSSTDPKVRFDSTGLYITKADGSKEVLLSSAGLRLLASQGTVDAPTQSRSVQWNRQADGVMVAQVGGGYQEGVGISFANLWALSLSSRNLAQIVSQAWDNSTGNQLSSGVFAKTNTQVRRILTEDGSSSFVKLWADGRVIISMGRVGLSYGGAAGGNIVFAHGLGAAPSGVVGIADQLGTTADGAAVATVGLTAWDGSNINLKALNPGYAGATTGTAICWLAWRFF